MTIPKRVLGKTGVEVTIMGLGGEGVLRTFGYEQEASSLINEAIDMGINYFESARAYSGSESYYGLALRERRDEIFLTSKSHGRDRAAAEGHLRETLANMNTDHLDLWQVHDVRTEADVAQIFGPGGAIEAFSEAKEKGLTRFLGVTGHHDPHILRRCLDLYDFDTVLCPVNPAEPAFQNFMEIVIPAAVEKGMGIIGMKVYFRGMVARVPGFQGIEPYYRFALSQPVSTVVIGCDTIQQLAENVAAAENFQPMSSAETGELTRFIAPYADQLMYYKPENYSRQT